MTSPLSAAQSAQQSNRDGAGKYTTKAASEALDVDLAQRTDLDPRLIELARLVEDDPTLYGLIVDNDHGDVVYRLADTELCIGLEGNYLSVSDESQDSTDASENVAILDFSGTNELTAPTVLDTVRNVLNDRLRRIAARDVYDRIPVPGGNPGAELDGTLALSAHDGGSVRLHAPVRTDEYTAVDAVVVPFSLDGSPYAVCTDSEHSMRVERGDGTPLTRWEAEGVLRRVDAVCGTEHVLRDSLSTFEGVESVLTGPAE